MKHWNTAFLERLLQVQSTDLEIRKLVAQIHVYYQRSKEEDAELTRLKMEIARVDENIEAAESQNQMYSTTLEDIRTAIKGLLITKSGVPKPRTRSSTEALKIEEEKLGSLVEETAAQLGNFRAERDTLIEKADERAKILEKEQEGPEAEIRKLQQQIKKLEKKREEEVTGLPSMLLKHYDRLRSSRSGIGLTILRDGVCTVCRMQMPTAVISRMGKGERISICPACGRMVARIEIFNLLPSLEETADTPDVDDSDADSDVATDNETTKPAEAKKPQKESKAKKKSGASDAVGEKKKTKKKVTKKSAASKSNTKKSASKTTKASTKKTKSSAKTSKAADGKASKKTATKKVAASKSDVAKKSAKVTQKADSKKVTTKKTQ